MAGNYPPGLSPSDPRYCARPTEVHNVRLRFNHGGMFVKRPSLMYIKGQMEEMNWGWDVDEISHIDLTKLVKSIGYRDFKCMWYRHPKLSLARGLRPLNSDGDVLKFAEDVKGFEVIDVYVEHLIDNPILEEDTTNKRYKEVVEVEVIDLDNESEGDVAGDKNKGDGEGKGEGAGVEDKGDGDGKGEEAKVEDKGDGEGKGEGEGVEHKGGGECEGEGVGVEGEGETEVEDESGDDEEYVANDDDEVESDDTSMEDSDYDENWDWTTVLPPETVNAVQRRAPAPSFANGGGLDDIDIGGGTNVRAATSSKNPKPTSAADFDNEDGDSDLLETPPESEDDEEERAKFPKFRLSEDSANVRFEVGLMFNTKGLVKEAVKEYAMVHKKNLHIKKNDGKRMVIRCMKGCPFYLRVSKSSQSQYWQVVSFIDDHTCHRTAKNRQAKTEWLAKKFIPTLRHTPDMKTKGLIAEAINRWGVKLSHHQAYRAKRRVLEKIQGAGSEQYQHLRSYAEELRRSNPNSTVISKCDMGNNGPVFERIYVCFEACKAAFVHTCRPLIGLDGCFLKGEYGGQLVAAVGKDGNNQMVPIAFAVVEAETKDSWKWFVDLLLEDLGGIQQKTWAFISDQQKGLVPTIKALRNNVEHRLCMKHLYGNWRKKYPGAEMKEVLWMAARATTVPAWQRAMEKMKAMDENAYKDMMELQPLTWTRSAYSTHTKCDLQVNNMCEAFNRAILEYRDKPIITMIEGLKFYITNRVVNQRDLMLRYRGNICPRIQQLLEKIKSDADGWTPNWAGDDGYSLFEVSKDNDKYVVKLTERSCSCRKWDLTGIPCCHGVTCMWHNNYAPEEYVSVHYRKNTFLATYSHIIMPSNGPKLWPIVDCEPINPPHMRRAPGRPNKQRKKRNDEPLIPHKLPRQSPTVKCKKCGKLGHNIRTCKGKTTADREIPKGANKRQKRKHQAEPSTQSGTPAQTEPCTQEVSATAPQTQESQAGTADQC